jgi:hypothetical protein
MNRKPDTEETRLAKLFTSRGCTTKFINHHARELADLIRSGLVTMSKVPMPPPVSNQLLDLHGGDDHRALGRIGFAWLLLNGSREIFIEETCAVGRADLCAHDIRCIVECGTSRPNKVKDAIMDGYRLALVPYGTDQITVFDGNTEALREKRRAELFDTGIFAAVGL